MVQTATTTFIDDVATRITDEDHRKLPASSLEVDHHFDCALVLVGIAQNRDKAECLPDFYGRGSHVVLRNLARGGAEYTAQYRDRARYLGPHLHFRDRSHVGIDRRCQDSKGSLLRFCRFLEAWR